MINPSKPVFPATEEQLESAASVRGEYLRVRTCNSTQQLSQSHR